MTRAQDVGALRVVVIDDAEEIRAVLRLALEREPDFSVVAEAADGESGIKAVIAHQPDLVLLDIAMPVMDGLQVLRLIRHESPASVVVMLSGFAENAAALSAVELGAHGYIRKGASVPELLAQLRDVRAFRFEEADREARADSARGDNEAPDA